MWCLCYAGSHTYLTQANEKYFNENLTIINKIAIKMQKKIYSYSTNKDWLEANMVPQLNFLVYGSTLFQCGFKL